MRLLFITRKVDKNDGLAGFTYNWLAHFAKSVEHLDVICLESGFSSGLPANVKVYSLGKENGATRWQQIRTFNSLAKKLVKYCDGVFTHQNPEYGLLAAPWAIAYRKKLIAWYTHKQVTWKLRLLNILATAMVTASAESFRLASRKLHVLHHGIDTDQFSFMPKEDHDELRLLSVCRISPTKNIDLMIDLVDGLREELDQPVVLQIVGAPALPTDHAYLKNLKREVSSRGLQNQVKFVGSIANDQVATYYHWADVFLNFSNTGSLDKAVLEAMSCGTLAITSNQAFQRPFLDVFPEAYLGNFTNMTERVIEILEKADESINKKMSDYVKNNHDLTQLTEEIITLFSKL